MKKLFSLIRASMTSGMQLFKINAKKNSKSKLLIPLFLAGYLMFMMWGLSTTILVELAPYHMQYVLLTIFVLLTSIMTVIEGIYKSGPLIFDCKDDQLLLSLPIERKTVLFVRIFKFYVFELMFNSVFLLPAMIAYISYADSITWTYYLSSFIMLVLLPIIPIVISCVFGFITYGIASKFKYKNLVQIVISMIFLLCVLSLSFNIDNSYDFITKNATSINEIITRIYYPAGVYIKLINNFNVIDLIIFIIVNIGILGLTIFILSKVYFKINSRLKSVSTTKRVKSGDVVIQSKSVYTSLIKKELITFFKTPVFIINAGFGLVIFIIAAISLIVKFDGTIEMISSSEGIGIAKEVLLNNKSILVLLLVIVTGFMTSITNSVISLEGKNINILKSLPVESKTILMSKIYSSLCITTPVLLLGILGLFVKLRFSIIELLLLIVLSILIPLVSHFIGLLINLKYPKLDATNSTEVVKQSFSSFLSVLIGFVLLFINAGVISYLMGKINPILLLIICIVVFLIVDLILYLLLKIKGVKLFNELTV